MLTLLGLLYVGVVLLEGIDDAGSRLMVELLPVRSTLLVLLNSVPVLGRS